MNHFRILLWGFKCDKVFKLQQKNARISSLNKYNAHTDPLLKILKLLKVNDILKLQEFKFYYKHKNNKLPQYLQSLPYHKLNNKGPRIDSCDTHTCIKHKMHNTIGKHVFAKNCLA